MFFLNPIAEWHLVFVYKKCTLHSVYSQYGGKYQKKNVIYKMAQGYQPKIINRSEKI